MEGPYGSYIFSTWTVDQWIESKSREIGPGSGRLSDLIEKLKVEARENFQNLQVKIK